LLRQERDRMASASRCRAVSAAVECVLTAVVAVCIKNQYSDCEKERNKRNKCLRRTCLSRRAVKTQTVS